MYLYYVTYDTLQHRYIFTIIFPSRPLHFAGKLRSSISPTTLHFRHITPFHPHRSISGTSLKWRANATARSHFNERPGSDCFEPIGPISHKLSCTTLKCTWQRQRQRQWQIQWKWQRQWQITKWKTKKVAILSQLVISAKSLNALLICLHLSPKSYFPTNSPAPPHPIL